VTDDSERWPNWRRWLDGLTAADRERAESLRRTFERCGARDPISWAHSEVTEDFAELARFAFLRAIWREIDAWRDPGAIASLLPNASQEFLEGAADMPGRVALEVARRIVQIIDDGEDDEDPGSLPGWRLMELPPGDEVDELTGRDLSALHESFFDVDPRP
jgi:hypothetical protein